MATMDNLKAAFAGESQANRKYLAFAKKADEDGFKQVAKLFKAAAAAETLHAHAHLRVMGGIKDTVSNLQEAAAGENHEFTAMYPGFVAEAEKEGNKPAVMSFKNAMAAEKVHFDHYTRALESVKAGKDLAAEKIFLCTICGNTVFGAAPATCPICGAPAAKFSEVR